MTALRRSLSPRHLTVFVLLLTGSLFAAYALPRAQAPAKKALTIDDYTKWRSIERQSISGDGKWVVYTLQTTNVVASEAKPVLHVLNLETSADVTVADATDGTFSPDSKWIAYQVDPGAAQRGRSGRGGSGAATPAGAGQPQIAPSGQGGTQPGQGAPSTGSGQAPSTGSGQGRGGAAPAIPPRRVELRNLATGEVRSWQDIGTFAFSATSTHLYLRRRGGEAAPAAGGRGGGAPGGQPPTGAGQAAGAAAAPAGPRGVDAILLDLRTGRHQLLGSVADIAFNRTGELLAYTVDAAVKDVNGLFVLDTRTGRTTTLDSDAKSYNRLTWNEEGNALAVLKGSDVEKMRERDNVLVAFPDVAAALKDGASIPAPSVLQPAKVDSFPKGWVVSDRATLAWSEDNTRVFFGIKEQVASPDTTRRTTDEAADVDVWNTSDDRVQSLQMNRANQDRNFTFRQAFDVQAKRFIKLTDDTMKDLDVAPDGKWAVGRDTRAYLADQKKLPAADFYRVNTSTGERTLIAKGQLTGRHVFGISPHGTHFLYWKDSRFQVYDLEANATRTLGVAKPPVSFIDVEDDHPGTKPSFGIAGYTSDGKSVIVNHQYDLWVLPLDGSAPTNLTGGLGSKSEMRFRLVRTEQVDPSVPRAVGPRGTFDLAKPVTLSAYGQWTKKAGFYELSGGKLKELVYEDASFSTPVKARKADRYLFTRQTFVEFPDLRVSGPGFADSKKITDANPQQKDFLWGHRVLFDFKNKDGVRLQGILAVPDDYKPGEKRPMIVTFYEKNSQNMHVYTPPVYMVSMGRMPTQAIERRLPDDDAGRPLPDRFVAQRHAGVRRGGHAQGDRDGLRRPEAHRRHRPQLRRRGRGLRRDDVEDVRRGRHGRGRGRSLQRLQHELGLVVCGTGRQRRHGVPVLPLRPGTLGLLAVGPARPLSQRVGADVGAEGGRAVPDHARHLRSDRRLHQRPRVLQRAPLQREEGRAAGLPERGTPPGRGGEPERPDGAVHGVLRSLPEGRAGAEVAERRGAVPEEGREPGAGEAGTGEIAGRAKAQGCEGMAPNLPLAACCVLSLARGRRRRLGRASLHIEGRGPDTQGLLDPCRARRRCYRSASHRATNPDTNDGIDDDAGGRPPSADRAHSSRHAHHGIHDHRAASSHQIRKTSGWPEPSVRGLRIASNDRAVKSRTSAW